MKISLILLLGSVVLFSSCKKEDDIAPNRLLDGEFTGTVLLEGYNLAGQNLSKTQDQAYSLNLSIDGQKFERADCGCAGEASINEAESTITFTTSQADCATNWIIRTFRYSVVGDKINLLFEDDLNKKLSDLRKTNTEGAFSKVTISIDGIKR